MSSVETLTPLILPLPLQTYVDNFQIQLNTTAETQISAKCEKSVTAAIAQLH